jgi:hypothetical protein
MALTTGKGIASLISNMRPEGMTLELLHAAVNTEDSGGYEGMPSSYGMDWIYKHIQQFLELLEEHSLSVEEFFRDHFSNRYIGGILHSDLLLLTLGKPAERTAFVREVFLAVGAPNQGWLYVALDSGINKADLAEMILEKVRSAPVVRSSIWSWLRHDFLVHGSGRVFSNSVGHVFFESGMTYWSILSDEQLHEAMQVIADRMPNELFGGPHVNERVTLAYKIAGRLGRDMTLALLERASHNLTSLDGVQPYVLDEMPLDAQLRVARRLLPQRHYGCQWVVQMATQRGSYNGGLALIKEFTGQFAFAGLHDYKAWYVAQNAADRDQSLLDEIGRIIRLSLEQQGWMIGTITEGQHRDQRQLQVTVPGERGTIRYVKDRYQHSYHDTYISPAAGDIVAFRPEVARELVPNRVRAMSFTLVHRPK